MEDLDVYRGRYGASDEEVRHPPPTCCFCHPLINSLSNTDTPPRLFTFFCIQIFLLHPVSFLAPDSWFPMYMRVQFLCDYTVKYWGRSGGGPGDQSTDPPREGGGGAWHIPKSSPPHTVSNIGGKKTSSGYNRGGGVNGRLLFHVDIWLVCKTWVDGVSALFGDDPHVTRVHNGGTPSASTRVEKLERGQQNCTFSLPDDLHPRLHHPEPWQEVGTSEDHAE